MQKEISKSNTVPSSLSKVNLLFSKSCDLEIKNYQIEKESSAYKAWFFDVDKKKAAFRAAKITPKKVGLFVTLWKRNKRGATIPFDEKDNIDLIIIEVENSDRIGHFVFNKRILVEKGIISSKKEGKRGFRIYPPWELPPNKQATTTQFWQSDYFFEFNRMTTATNRYLQRLINL
ncbi:MepB family protein [Leptospira haakeii]|uniref:MepB protein n=1 Tax=Leptospira haakeii TaxID=2023198 RepID=A0ABX4PI06_9LEPT|nr:MepB family protein [Leptospira haakeii]PKA14317.1 MepB protein [Leptospira haakeii]PKA18175.1 MepB protein [Leptospira haakeii]